MDRGGLVGALEYWAISSLFSGAGAHLLSSWAFPPACCWPPELLLRASCPPCGDSLAGVEPGPAGSGTPSPASGNSPREDALGFPRRGAGGRVPREALGSRTDHARQRGRGPADTPLSTSGLDAAIAEDPLEQVEREVDAAEEAALTPQGLKRSSITESEEISYRLPTRRSCGARRLATAPTPPTRTRSPSTWSRRSGTSGSRHSWSGAWPGPRDAPRAAAGARDQGLQGDPAEGRPGLRACLDRHPDPRRPSRASRRSASRCPTSATGWSTSATSSNASCPRVTARRARPRGAARRVAR